VSDNRYAPLLKQCKCLMKYVWLHCGAHTWEIID
jgi:hypothetical protein